MAGNFSHEYLVNNSTFSEKKPLKLAKLGHLHTSLIHGPGEDLVYTMAVPFQVAMGVVGFLVGLNKTRTGVLDYAAANSTVRSTPAASAVWLEIIASSRAKVSISGRRTMAVLQMRLISLVGSWKTHDEGCLSGR